MVPGVSACVGTLLSSLLSLLQHPGSYAQEPGIQVSPSGLN